MNVTRVSRPLVGILGLTLLVGGIYFIAHHKRGNPNNAAAAALASDSKSATPNSAAPAVKPAGAGALARGSATQPIMLAAGVTVPMPQPMPSVSGPSSLAEGKAKLAAGDLLNGRKLVNDALNSGALSAVDVAAAKALIADANKILVFSPQQFSTDPYGGSFQVPPGGVMTRIAKRFNVTPELLCRINGLSDPRRLRASQTIKVLQGPFHAVVNKSAFTMDLYLGGVPGDKGAMYITTFPVGLGKDDSTPTGTWICEPGRKLTNPTYYSPRGEGVIQAGDPKNPLGKFWIGLAGTDGQAVGKTSYGIHGNIDPDSIGKQASMGCIRMKNEDIAVVYEMLIEGKSDVIVKD